MQTFLRPRCFVFLLLSVAVLGSGMPFASAAGLEFNTNRAGMDFQSIALRTADPKLCESACFAYGNCKSFTFVRPGARRQPAMCYLKNGTPAPQRDRCCVSGLRPEVSARTENTTLYRLHEEWRNRRVPRISTTGRHDSLADYAAKCDAATGITVPSFSCDNGVEVPGQGNGQVCDKPNVLNHMCDPGSKFQVLPGRTADAVAVAHCRKVGQQPGSRFFDDIAVIQHNKANGATCFYQALTLLPGDNIPAPGNAAGAWSDGVQHWITPRGTEAIGCTGCHDSGAFIRSPYLAQMRTAPHILPTTGQGFDNLTPPLKFVGLDYASNRSWSISTALAANDTGTSCTACHRLAVSNHEAVVGGSLLGTSLEFATIATAATQASKNPHSQSSPIWMRPGQVTYVAAAEASAQRIKDCAIRFRDSRFATTPAGCTITPLAEPFSPPNPPPHDNPIACKVWNDTGWESGLSEAIYFSAPNQACVPDGTARGSCGRWFGRCVATNNNASVSFKLFDDGDSNQTDYSDGVYANSPGRACIADGSATGNCRKWFGKPVSSDRHVAECYLFDDGLTNWIGPTDAIYYNSAGKVCMPDGTGTGACRKWFGNCQVTPQVLPPPPPAPSPIACKVWNDNGTEFGFSDSVFFPGSNLACVPDGTGTGACGRWFGRCVASADNAPVSFKLFNDGASNQTVPSDGVYANSPNNVCIADGTAAGTCRKWFGLPTTADGRAASCYLYDDGYSHRIGPTDAIFYGGPNKVCMPDGTATGACRKWFGQCQVPGR